MKIIKKNKDNRKMKTTPKMKMTSKCILYVKQIKNFSSMSAEIFNSYMLCTLGGNRANLGKQTNKTKT